MDYLELEHFVSEMEARYVERADEFLQQLSMRFKLELQGYCDQAKMGFQWASAAASSSFGLKLPDAGLPSDANWNPQLSAGLTASIPFRGASSGTDSTINSTGIQKAIATIAAYSRQTLGSIENKLTHDQAALCDSLQRAQALLQEPLVGSQMVTSHDLVQYVRRFYGTGSDDEIKHAALLIRELLVLHKTYGLKKLDSDEFEDAMTEVFARQLDSELMSQLALAFTTIIRLGKDWDAFQKSSPKIFRRSLSTDEMALLFVVYSHCATASPLYVSRAKSSGKQRGRKKKHGRHAEELELQPAGVGHDGEQLHGSQGVMEVPEDPWWVILPGMTDFPHPSDPFDFQGSSCSSSSGLNPRKVDPSGYYNEAHNMPSTRDGSVQNKEN